ncbi:hypothetical protein [Occultella kanbiaonis]|uniref:hypothetical protein n=1 Tax=Occultella kanbiaonis TaxID=2675754 RepID=UPI0013D09DCA|nr:hypothetical protein [Occultella kanbiaonis]
MTTTATQRRPRVAIIATTWFTDAHADVIGTRLVQGYSWAGHRIDPRVEVASVYVEQLGAHAGERLRPDIAVELTDRHGVPRYPSVAEAIGLGRGGVNVDGVVIIGEHGDYEENEFGQKLYPRRRLFDAVVATMIGAGRTVPVFTDKHLAWSFADAHAMYEVARRHAIPLLAGSSVPLAWREPTGSEWPLGAPMTDAVGVCYGSTEAYGFHSLEGIQVFAERRAGGESGVRSVRTLTGAAAASALTDGTVDAELFERALATLQVDPRSAEEARRAPQAVFLIEYLDGLRAASVNCQDAVAGFATAARGPADEAAAQLWLQDGPEYGHFIFLVRQIESMMLARRTPYPVERTLLTTGILAAAMRSLRGGARLDTPELAISYQPTAHVPDTGVQLPVPGAPAGGR